MNSASTNNVNPSTMPEQEFGYGQLFAILWRRRLWFLAALCLVLPLTAFALITQKSEYASSMRLLVESNYQGKSSGQTDSEFADPTIQIDYSTQLNLMRSAQLIRRAVELLQNQYPDISIEDIQGGLDITHIIEKAGNDDVETKIFQVDFVSDDPVKSQAVLEAIQKVYQEYNLEQQNLRLKDGLAFLNEQLPRAQQNVSEAEGALEKFRAEERVVDPQEQAASVASRLQQVKADQSEVLAQIQQGRAKYDSLQKQLGSSSPQAYTLSARLSQSTRYQNLLNQLQDIELKLAERRSFYTDVDPGIEMLLEQRQKIQELLQQEVTRVLRGVSPQSLPNGEALLQQGQFGELDLNLVLESLKLRTEIIGLQARESSLAATEQELAAELEAYPNLIAQYERLQPEVEINRQTLTKLLEARQELAIELARGGFNWQVIDPPLFGEETGLSPSRKLLIAGVVALFLGGVAAFVREALDNSIHTPQQLQAKTSLPLLGTVPQVSNFHLSTFLENGALSEDVLNADYSFGLRESVDFILKSIQLTDSKVRSLAVTSALPGEGKSTLALFLALSAARQHKRVLLVDANLRNSVLHQWLKLPALQGLTTILRNKRAVAQPHKISIGDSSLDVITAGPQSADPVQLLSSRRLREYLAEAEEKYDLVIIDTPPILGLVDALEIASVSQSTVIVGRIHQITQDEIITAVGLLSRLNVIGLIANGDRKIQGTQAKYYRNTPREFLNEYG